MSGIRRVIVSYTIGYDEENGCICVTVTGKLSLSSMKELAPAVQELLLERGCCRVLNNMKDAVLTDSASEAYYMPAVALKSGIQQSVKRALVVREITPVFLFLETVFLNSGNIVKMFVDLDEARQWLFSGNASDM
jgi:hypothetical protein